MTTPSFDERSAEAKEHERRAAVILDGMCQFVALLNPRGGILEVNRAALEGAGHRIEEIQGKPFWTARWWQISEQIRNDLQRAIKRAAAGEFVRYEVDIYGEQSGLASITIDFSLQPIRGESGEIEYLLSEGRNITERKRAEASLRHSEERFRRLLDTLPVGAYTCDAEGLITYFNERAVKAWGRAPKLNDPVERFCGSYKLYSSDGKLIHHDQCWMALAIKENKAYEGHEIVIERPDGSRLTVLAHVNPFYNEAGNLLGAVNIVVDITDRKQAEEVIARMAAIVESSDDAIVGKDLNGIILSWNKGAEKIFGYTAEEVIGKSIMILVPPDRENEESYILDCIRRGERIVHYETVRRCKENHEIYVSLTVSPIRDKAGKIIGVSKIARDVSERKRIEVEREELLLKESASRAEAEAANRSKDEFLALVSHELRSPLNAILGWNRLLFSQRGDDPQIAKVVEIVERSGKAQLQLIEDLLDSTRIVTGKMKLELEPVELAYVVSSALDALRPAADNKGIVISANFDPEAGQITGDPGRLRQVVWNLASNAIKFTPEGGRVWVELRRGPDAQIVVRDTGQGIGADLLPYVFDRFKQGDSSTTRRLGGLGLGLALVKHLVELHGGCVTVESPGEGLGATFTVNLPVRAVKGGAAAEGRKDGGSTFERRVRREPPATRLEGVRVLVVDDEASARELLAATLGLRGVSVTAADSADAALAEIESRLNGSAAEPFDVLISDIGMPGIDGYELLRRVREHPDGRVSRIRAIALTAYARSEDRLRALQAGFHMHVPKPVDEEELTIVIASLTARVTGS
jgi:PAS domain S-box-containing protein